MADAYSGIRADFRARPHISDHFRRTNHWNDGLVRYSFFGIIEDDVAVSRLLAIQQRFERPYLVSVAPESLHVTLVSIGTVATVSSNEAQDLVRLTKNVRTEFEAEPFQLGPVGCLGEGPFVGVLPHDRLEAAREALSVVCEAVLGNRFEVVPPILPPHVALAYGAAEAEADDLVAEVERAASEPVISSNISVELVKLARPARQYLFERVLD